MGRKKGSGGYSREKIEKLIFEKHGDNVIIDFSTYKGTDKTCKFFDKDYGEFWNNPYNVYKCGQGHRERFVNSLKKDFMDMQKKIDNVFDELIKIVPQSYINSHKKCEFIDREYGNFFAYPHNVLNLKQRHPNFRKTKIEDYLILGKERKNSSTLRMLILQNNLLEYKCAECGQEPQWREKELVLDLHHIDGNRGDNRIENLCFLCPNCHTQTFSFKGRNIHIKEKLNSKICIKCKKEKDIDEFIEKWSCCKECRTEYNKNYKNNRKNKKDFRKKIWS